MQIIIDTWISDLVKKVMTDVATHIIVEELKRRLIDQAPKEKLAEFQNRLDSSLKNLSRIGVGGKDIIVRLSQYPGLVTLFQDEDFRKRYLKFDVGNGCVLLDRDIKDFLPISKLDYEHKALKALDETFKETLWPSYTTSLPSIMSQIKEQLKDPAKTPFAEQLSQAERILIKERTELEGLKNRVLNLEIPITEYQDSISKLIRQTSEVVHDHLKEIIKALDGVWSKVDNDTKPQIYSTLIDLTLRLLTIASMIDSLGKIFGVKLTGYAYWPHENVRILVRKLISIRSEIGV